jgi:hypothetical protein
VHAGNEAALVEEGGVEALIQLLLTGEAEAKTAAAGALRNLNANEAHDDKLVSIEVVDRECAV